jgi:hypothetical protein
MAAASSLSAATNRTARASFSHEDHRAVGRKLDLHVVINGQGVHQVVSDAAKPSCRAVQVV